MFSLNDGEWTAHAVPGDVTVTGIETPADGSVWVSQGVAGPGQGRPGDAEDRPAGGRAGVARMVDGESVEEDVEPAVRPGDGGYLAVGPDGTALLGTSYYSTCPDGAWTGIMERTEDGSGPVLHVRPGWCTTRLRTHRHRRRRHRVGLPGPVRHRHSRPDVGSEAPAPDAR